MCLCDDMPGPAINCKFVFYIIMRQCVCKKIKANTLDHINHSSGITGTYYDYMYDEF